MEMLIDFPGGERVDAHFANFTVPTDQLGSYPPPFAYFLASIGTCAGIYVLKFCQQRGLSTDGVRVIQRSSKSADSGLIDKIELEIQVPPTFPTKYYDALIHAAELCTVKRHLENPPSFKTYTKVVTA